MNHFEISGIVEQVETKQTQRGTPFHILTVRDTDDRTIPVCYFGSPPRAGVEVEFRGRLTGRNGYLNLEIETSRFGDGPPKVRRGAKVEKPVTAPIDDDMLPF